MTKNCIKYVEMKNTNKLISNGIYNKRIKLCNSSTIFKQNAATCRHQTKSKQKLHLIKIFI